DLSQRALLTAQVERLEEVQALEVDLPVLCQGRAQRRDRLGAPEPPQGLDRLRGGAGAPGPQQALEAWARARHAEAAGHVDQEIARPGVLGRLGYVEDRRQGTRTQGDETGERLGIRDLVTPLFDSVIAPAQLLDQ